MSTRDKYEYEQKARAELEAASAAVQEYRNSHPPFTPVPEELFDALDAARSEHNRAYAAAYY